MRTVITRATSYAGGVLAALLIWEILTLQLPSGPSDETWRSTVAIHGLLVAAVSAIALIGGAIGFAILKDTPKVALMRLAIMGAIVGWPLGSVFVALGVSAGFPVAAAATLLIASAVAYVGARFSGGANAA